MVKRLHHQLSTETKKEMKELRRQSTLKKPFVVESLPDQKETPVYFRPSKSQLKREMTAKQDLGKILTSIDLKKSVKAPISDGLKEALRLYHQIARHNEAGRRQLQLIGKLMRDEDKNAIELWLIQQQLLSKREMT
jgi:ribosomal 50S subunit-associated protein YjgA (DUF615 family)